MFNYGRISTSFVAAPYVLNGPVDQNDFHDKLILLQQNHAPTPKIPWEIYRTRLSLIETVGGEQLHTSQFGLESPKPTAKSWSSNYGPHGWHRYVGRFPPHLVRALLNHFECGPEDLVLDPFLGSGTTLVECRLLGIPAIGIEICPLSVLMSRAKACFPEDPSQVLGLSERFHNFYQAEWESFVGTRDCSEITYDEILERKGNSIERFPNLEKWLTKEALLGVSICAQFAASLPGIERDLVLTAVSAKMRSIGNVDVDVVRAEYSKKPRTNVNVRSLVGSQIAKIIGSIDHSVRSHRLTIGEPGLIKVLEGDVLKTSLPPRSVSAVITSPPYGVEAISYLRTHLLSYRCLGQFLGTDPYEFGHRTIGSEYLADVAPKVNSDGATKSTTYRETFSSMPSDSVGRNQAVKIAMMKKYFEDMNKVVELLSEWVKPGGHLAMVIGDNAIAGRTIPTHHIMTELFEANGFRSEATISHKLKSNNSNSQVPWQERTIKNEFILLFTRR